MRKGSKRGWLAAAGFVAIMAPATGARAAEKILLLQKPISQSSADAFTAANTLMTQLGYDVTTIQGANAAVPVNVADYAQVYLLSDGLMNLTDASMLVTYVQNGGHLFVSGENDGVANQPENLLVQDHILKPLVTNSSSFVVGPPFVTPGIRGLDVLAERSGFSTHPNTLSKIYVYTSGFLTGVPDTNVFLKDGTNGAVGAVWLHDELTQGTGCLMAMTDVTWWEVPNEPSAPVTNADLLLVIENIHDTLKYCGDHDLDGLLDTEEAALGTNPTNPDSDGDGLCDGTIAVNDPSIPQKCIAGEDAKGGQKTAGPMIDALNPDDDGDGIPTATELADSQMFSFTSTPMPWRNLDSDGDGVSDMMEGRKHFNAQGLPDYLDPNYPTPQPTSSSTSSGTGAGTGAGGASSGSATGSGGGGGSGSGSDTGGGCNCFIGGPSTASGQALFGAVALFGAAYLRSRRRRVG